MRPRILALGSTTRRNRIGRTFSLWLTARAAGFDFKYFCIDDGPVWEPLREHDEFLADVHAVSDLARLQQDVNAAAQPNTTLLVCKPRPELLRLVMRLRSDIPILVDIDDPELLDPWGDSSLVLRAKRIARFGPSPFRFRWARRVVKSMNVITSNPMLRDIYGGTIVPHVREIGAPPEPRPRTLQPFTIAFVGTPREHKGLEEIRAATASLARTRDVRLRVTAAKPLDARPWEEWVGETSLREGRRILEQSDAVAIVSRPGVWGDLQLPVKLIDAMAAGVPAVVTARPPVLWAAAGSAVVVRDGSVSDLEDAFALIADNTNLASALGASAWKRARELFTPAAASSSLKSAIQRSAARPNARP
jgi:glycosyltransferase involved in cell wall biosynthesis